MSKVPKIIYDFDPRNIPPEALQAIGLVTTASSQTESMVRQLIGGLLGIDHLKTGALTTHMAGPLKDHIARSLAEIIAPDIKSLDELDDLLDAINLAFEKRNVIVHNEIMRDPATDELWSWREKSRGSYQLELKPIRVEDLREDAATIYKVGMDLMEFMMRAGLLPELRETPMREPLDRRKSAREKRRNTGGGGLKG